MSYQPQQEMSEVERKERVARGRGVLENAKRQVTIIRDTMLPSRETSLAITKAEECVMWLEKAQRKAEEESDG